MRRLALLATVVAAVAVAILARRDSDSDAVEWVSVTDRETGIALSHPSGWAVQQTNSHCMRIGPGLIVSNVRGHTFRRFETPTACSSEWLRDQLPDSHAFLAVSAFYPPPRALEGPDTELPLELKDFSARRAGYAGEALKCGTALFFVSAYTGADVSPRDEAVLARLVRFLRCPKPAST
jgi:hypothetical protein